MKNPYIKLYKKDKIRVFKFNVCKQPCACGWNISIGSLNKNAFKDIQKLLVKYGSIDARKNKRVNHSATKS